MKPNSLLREFCKQQIIENPDKTIEELVNLKIEKMDKKLSEIYGRKVVFTDENREIK